MFDPLASESHEEFIEIINLSDSDVDVAGWQISDGSGTDNLIAHQNGTTIASGQFAIIFDPSYFENSTVYDSLVSANALILTIDNNTFGSAGLSNSTAETISLINAQGDTISVYTYSLGNQPGFSDEKVDLFGGNSADNWKDSKTLYGTPGSWNSQSPLDFDLSVEDISFFPEIIKPNESTTVTAHIHNIGLESAVNFTISIFADFNTNGSEDVGEALITPIIIETSLPAADSISVSAEFSATQSGFYNIYSRVEYTLDQDNNNNMAFGTVGVAYAENSLRINEIMYSPLPGQPEWIEIVNTSSEAIDLQNWAISDNNVEDLHFITQSFLLQPNEFVVISRDSSILDIFTVPENTLLILSNWPVLNNTEDSVILYDLVGSVIDQVNYERNWGGGSGISLEKINPVLSSGDRLSWSSSVAPEGGTPGSKNSIFPPEYDLSISRMLVSPENINPNESAVVAATIQNAGLNPASNFEVSFFVDYNANSLPDIGEEFVQPVSISETLLPGDSTKIEVQYSPAQSGAYTIYAEIHFDLDENTTNNSLATTVSVGFSEMTFRINEIMYSPFSRQPEWIEILNMATEIIDIQNWAISDNNVDDLHLINRSFPVAPNEFVVICRDSSILDIFNLPDSSLLVLNNFPTLNNTEDSVILYDFVGSVIDQVNYSSAWGGRSGVSLEKINPALPSDDQLSWGSSVAPEGGTPGIQNSIFPPEYDLSVTKISISPEILNPGETATITATVKNAGLNPASNFEVFFFADFNANLALDNGEEFDQPVQISSPLLPGDSISVEAGYLATQPGSLNLFAEINYYPDDDVTNNLLSGTIRVGFSENSLRINEIMYSPLAEQPEWIELVNTSADAINLLDWAISDDNLDEPKLIDSPITIKPNGFIVFSADSSLLDVFNPPENTLFILPGLPSLNNSNDSVVLFDLVGNIIDRVDYVSDWGGDSGISLEKINPKFASNDSLNWSASVAFEGGTPGEPNSIFSDVLPSSTSLSIKPNPFSPDNDGNDDFAIISYNLPVTTAQINLKIYDLRGRLIRYLANNKSTGSTSTIVWDGRNDDGNIARIGIYVVFLEALNAQAGVLEHKKKTVVLAGRL